jgi:hypothetical protein
MNDRLLEFFIDWLLSSSPEAELNIKSRCQSIEGAGLSIEAKELEELGEELGAKVKNLGPGLAIQHLAESREIVWGEITLL